jgi:hypothetical protein
MATDAVSTASNVHINSEGKKMYTINTDLWDDKIRNTLMAHFGDFSNTENMPPEEQAIHASIAEKLKPVFENRKPLIVNDLSAKTHETNLSEAVAFSEGYGNKPAKPVSPLQPLTPQNHRQATTTTFAGNTILPENQKSLITNDLNPKTPENNLSVAIALSEGYGNEPFSSHSSVAKATENLETLLQGLRKAFLQIHPQQPNDERYPNTTSNAAPLPENEKPLIINDLSAKTPETTGNKPATPIDPLFVGYPTSSTPPDPTVPYTYFNGKMLLTKYPDGRIRYDYGGGRPAITITKGGPAILERRVFYI